jgi:hypothetical protein
MKEGIIMKIYWKFTRSGKVSKNYISLIFDIHEDNYLLGLNQGIMNFNFSSLEMILLLIQEVELINNPFDWFRKYTLVMEVNKCGYRPTNNYKEQRHEYGLVIDSSVMGRHTGSPLDYGLINFDELLNIQIDVSKLKFSAAIDAKTGYIGYGNDDKLECFRDLVDFKNEGEYYDLMPVHSVIPIVYSAMFNYDAARTINFVENVLKWERI